MSRPRILFVDDEPPVLAALENVLRRDRTRWDLSFAIGWQAALRRLADETFDVVVCDLSMPELDGFAVLARVRELNPAAGRIVLSGRYELAVAIRALPVAQQFLHKPCDPDALRAAIERSLAPPGGAPRTRDSLDRLDDGTRFAEDEWMGATP